MAETMEERMKVIEKRMKVIEAAIEALNYSLGNGTGHPDDGGWFD